MDQWQTKGSETLVETRIFNLRKTRVVNPRTRSEFDAITLQCPDWVNVIAVTAGGEMVLVRQFRHGVGRSTLEIPGGMVDPGETPREAGIRELLEETGYAPAEVINLGFVDAQPAFQDNRCHTILALGCVKTAELTQDHGEDIEVELIPEARIDELMVKGEIAHGLVLAAFMRYHLWRNSSK